MCWCNPVNILIASNKTFANINFSRAYKRVSRLEDVDEFLNIMWRYRLTGFSITVYCWPSRWIRSSRRSTLHILSYSVSVSYDVFDITSKTNYVVLFWENQVIDSYHFSELSNHHFSHGTLRKSWTVCEVEIPKTRSVKTCVPIKHRFPRG